MSEQISERSQTFTTSRNLLLSGADAVERIMTSFKEVSKVIWTSFYKHIYNNIHYNITKKSKKSYIHANIKTKPQSILLLMHKSFIS